MKIYFYTNQYLNNQDSQEVKDCLKKSGVEVLSNFDQTSEAGAIGNSLDKVDAFVFQGEKLDTKASYFLALVLAQNKEILCLLPQGTKPETSLKDLCTDSKLAKKIHIELYDISNLKEKVLNFLKIIDSDSIRNLFNIKYTLRVSGKLADYLNWKAGQQKVKKADWIRDYIQKIMQEDQEYQEFVKNKFSS